MAFKMWNVGCCCNVHKYCGCYIDCNGYQLPKNDFYVDINPPWNLRNNDQSSLSNTVLHYNNDQTWTNCIKGDRYTTILNMQCNGQNPEITIGYGNGDSCDYSTDYTLELAQKINNNPVSLKFTSPLIPNVITASGYFDAPGDCVTICNHFCGVKDQDALIVVSNSGGKVAQGVTGPDGCVVLDIGQDGFYDINITPQGQSSRTYQGDLSCLNTYSFFGGCSTVVNFICACNSDDNDCIEVNKDAEIVYRDPNGNEVDRGTTVSGVWVSKCVYPIDGLYSVTATYNGNSCTQNVPCGSFVTFGCGHICVNGCLNQPITDFQLEGCGSSPSISSKGCTLPFLACGNNNGNLIVKRFAPTFASCFAVGEYSPYGPDILAHDDNYICDYGNLPVCKTLQLIDSVLGQCDLTYMGFDPSVGSDYWQGTLTANPILQCGCPQTSVTVTYTLYLQNVLIENVGLVPTASLLISINYFTMKAPCNCFPFPQNPLVCIGDDAIAHNISLNFNMNLISSAYDPMDIVFQFQNINEEYHCYNCFDGNECAFQSGDPDPQNFVLSMPGGTLWGASPTTVSITIMDNC